MGSSASAKDVVVHLRLATADEFPLLAERYREDPRAGVQNALKAAQRRLECERTECERMHALYEMQRAAGARSVVVGIDEVGRGSVAGPLTVAAVALPLDPIIEGLDDSKRLSASRRVELAGIIQTTALAIGIAHIDAHDIDACGMGASLRVAMMRALAATETAPDLVLIDGNPIHIHPKERCIVKGDSKVACIAAASIVAKVTRDALMVGADATYPGYCFADSKGYASPEHIEAIKRKGLSDFHRVSFCRRFTQESLF